MKKQVCQITIKNTESMPGSNPFEWRSNTNVTIARCYRDNHGRLYQRSVEYKHVNVDNLIRLGRAQYKAQYMTSETKIHVTNSYMD